jgi:hypothetical protein
LACERLALSAHTSLAVLYVVSRILPLAYLAPDIAEAILAGRQPADLTVKRLRSLRELPAKWSVQRAKLGFAGWPEVDGAK